MASMAPVPQNYQSKLAEKTVKHIRGIVKIILEFALLCMYYEI
jgi:hypothetical protein